MAVTTTTRMGLTRWSSDGDPFTRVQLDTSASALETKAAGFLSGTLAARPAAAAAYDRYFYLGTDDAILYYCNGAAWFSVNAFATAGAITPGDTATAGTGTALARANHQHSAPSYGLVGELAATSTAAAAGSLAKFARIDHAHVHGTNSVVAGNIATGGVSASGQIAAGIVGNSQIAAGAVTKDRLATDQQLPSGIIMAYVGISVPTGWAWCDGASYDTTAQATLFAVTSYRYGGAGANFNVPDFRTRVPRGAAVPTTSGDLGLVGGADTVTIATTNLPSHSHTVASIGVASHTGHSHGVSMNTASANDDHTHGSSGTTADGGSHNHQLASGLPVVISALSGSSVIEIEAVGDGNDLWLGTVTNSDNGGSHGHSYSNTTTGSSVPTHFHGISGTTVTDGAHSHVLSGSTDTAGSGTAINVMPKYQTCNYIIKL